MEKPHPPRFYTSGLTSPAHFIASPLQLGSATISIVLLIAIAFFLPSPRVARNELAAPRPLVIGVAALVSGSIVLAIPGRWGWWAISLYVLLDVAMIWGILTWSRTKNWGAVHRLALSGGAAIAYALHSFAAVPAVGRPNRIGNTALLVALLTVLYLAASQIRRMHRESRHK